MSAQTPDDRGLDDDLDQAYARAHALADDGRGPSASVRTNVLAAAAEVAAQARERAAAEAAPPAARPVLLAVAPPVAEVGRGRPSAINLSSWRVRSGAAACAALLVALVSWRFEASHRFDAGEQVASASLALAAPPTAPLARELPGPSGASYPYAAPPPVVEDPVERAVEVASAKRVARERGERGVIVAQAEQADRSLRTAAPAQALAPAAAAAIPPAAAPAAPVVVASDSPESRATPAGQAPTTVTVTGPAATQFATVPAMPPSVLPRRVAVVPPVPAAAARPASLGETTTLAAAEPPRADVDAGPTAFPSDARNKASPAARGSLDSVGARLLPSPLQSAADRGDVDALKRLLADPATRVDAPDAAGRSALLHAVLAQRADAVRLLLAAGADPDRADAAGLTPRAAAQAGASGAIGALLAAPR